MALYLNRYGDGEAGTGGAGGLAPSPGSTFWTPGLILAALAIGVIVLLKGSERRARRDAREGRRWPPYERKARVSRLSRR